MTGEHIPEITTFLTSPIVHRGYFAAIDWVGKGGVFGQAQTFVVSIGLICSAISVNNYTDGGVPDSELALEVFIGSLLIAAGIFGIVREKVCPTCMDCSGPEAVAEGGASTGDC